MPQAAPELGGAEGNERLTAMTGTVLLLILLAVECYTILRIGRLLGGRGIRLALLVASLLAGLVIALLTVHPAGKWELNY